MNQQNSQYFKEKQESHIKPATLDENILEVLHELFSVEYNELVKVKRFEIQGSGQCGKIHKKE